MSPKLAESIFGDLSSLSEVAELLESTEKQLQYLLYSCEDSERYRDFTIAKRRGGERTINAPRWELKIIQQRLAGLLQDRITFTHTVHGFVRQRSIATNAANHVRHRTVLNVDLKDFFPTINFGRVRGLFMARPFCASPRVATILAKICCCNGSLPQGAPTSPVISNLICRRMDVALFKLAREHFCFYSRYADDLTISKRNGALPPDVATKEADGNVQLGSKFREIIETNGFLIHPEKIRLHTNTNRQIVTGLVVNRRVNVPRNFVREIRAMICDWRRNGLTAAEQTHHNGHYRRTGRLAKKPPLRSIIEGKLNFLKMVRGEDDRVRRNLQRQLVTVWPEYQEVMEKENNELGARDLFISHASEDKKDFVKPFVDALIAEGVTVWYDEYELTIGDDLVVKINEGLSKARYGVVILSPNFFNIKKTWPDREVGAMFALEDADKRPRVLPLWHNIDQATVASKNPMLAGKVAWKTSDFSPADLAAKFRKYLAKRRI